LFFFAITRASILQDLASCRRYEEEIGALIVTTATDGFMSKMVSSEDDLTITESPGDGSSKAPVFSRVSFVRSNGAVRVSRSLVSGRPIYYHTNPQGEFFCSTHMELLRSAGVPIRENVRALPELFAYGYVMPPTTLYDGVLQVPPGSSLNLEIRRGECILLSVESYVPTQSNGIAASRNHVEDRVLQHLRDGVGSLQAEEDSLAVFLSGGLDSSILLRVCQDSYGNPDTYSAEYPFEDPALNMERHYAESAAEALGSPHVHYSTTSSEYLKGMVQCIKLAEEPLHHTQFVMFYLLARQSIPCAQRYVISGLGADAVWGMDVQTALRRCGHWPLRALSVPPLSWSVKTLAASRPSLRESMRFLDAAAKMRRTGGVDYEDPTNIVWTIGGQGNIDWVCRYFGKKREDLLAGRVSAMKPFFGRNIYDFMSILEVMGDLSMALAISAKLMESMGKVVYYPYYQPDLVDYSYSLGWDVKLAKPKEVLRRVARKLDIPEFIITRPKSGFGIHRRDWVSDGVFEPLLPLVSDTIDPDMLKSLQIGGDGNSRTLWHAFNYAIWKRVCVDRQDLSLHV
jgi:asparagine synthetase B (glutamine-hydrolysing)